MTNTHRMTFTEESLAFALNQAHGLQDISTDLIAANVFRQRSGTTTTSPSLGPAIGVTDTDVDRLLDTIACLLPYAEDEAALTCDNQQNSEMAWDAVDKARDLLEEIERRRGEARPSTSPTTAAKEEHGLDQAEGCKPDFDFILSALRSGRHPASADVQAADNALKLAQVGLLVAVKTAYPVGSRVSVQAGQNTLLIEVTGHDSAWWSRPGYIHGKNRKTGKSRTFHHSTVTEVLNG
ncbi:hypothetical protein [Pseudomonas huaxiensis]|uniref:hypothetical protein n=1 Tax=Pseudomonas huaxiensis TaxID=2213017 RepID=UPI000DA69C06|nr:hypothetical protein [Pseudomonas huaxiensis]